MAYNQPAFMLDHLGAGLALAALTARNAGTFTNAAKQAMIDQRPAPAGSLTANAGNGGFVLDLGTTSAGDAINRAVIPAGHSFTGANLQVVKDTIPGMNGFPSPQIALTASTVPAGVIDFATIVNTDPGYRYWAFQYNLSTNGFVMTLGEFWLGTRTALTANAYVQPGFGSDFTQELAQDEFGGRTATVVLAPARRRFALEVLNLDPSGADYALLERVMKEGRERPFVYWPPDSVVPGPFFVQTTAATRRQEFRAPQAGIRYGVRLEMIEQLA